MVQLRSGGAPLLHHLSLPVSDLEASTRLYDAALAALGFERVWSTPDAVGYGPPGGGDKLALKRRGSDVTAPSAGFHVAFAAPDRKSVDAFWAAACAAGATDNGPPGLRPHYGPSYYAAFVIDLDGFAIEAVFNGP
ncbi:MAG: catechol 2,3-dioxygenase-like lactoylglutathione lyase family enzyme [Myxococcota bacterium]